MSEQHEPTAAVLDRCATERGRPGLLAELLDDPATRVLDVAGDRLPVRVDPDGVRRPVLRAPRPDDAAPVFLGRDRAGTAYVAVLHPTTGPATRAADDAEHGHAGAAPPRTVAQTRDWAGLREIGARLGPFDSELATAAVGLARWHERHPYCAGCGAPTASASAGWSRRCGRDGREHFPRTDPAVIVAITDPDDRLLLGRGPTFKEGWRSVLAGFVEPGESFEQTVAREMAEEVGLRVTDIRYVASQPWPFPASIMIGFTCRASGSRLTPDPTELAEVDWYAREQLAADVASGRLGIPGRYSIARRLIEDWYGGPLHPAREGTSIRTVE